MTPQVDDQFLVAMGLKGLPEDQKQEALETVLETLDMRVVMRLVNLLNEQQLDEFKKLTTEDADPAELNNWLTQNVPNYQDIIQEEAQKMKDEASSVVDNVMAKKDTSLSEA